MSGPFGAFEAALSGASMASRWMDTIAHNLANSNTMTSTSAQPFRARYLVVGEGEAGVDLQQIVQAQGEAPVVFAPDHPLADENGLIQAPVIDLAGQLSDLTLATRHYQVNLRVITSAREAYQAALSIGRS